MNKLKYTGYVYGEGVRDKKFLMKLITLDNFQYHTSNWSFNYGSAHGCSPKVILESCKKETSGYAYDLVLCFIDLDKLKEEANDKNKKWEKEKEKLEKEYKKIKIIWNEDCFEDEAKKVLGGDYGKHKTNKIARENVKKFINSSYYKKILKAIQPR
ncbi:MAG: hypothetical protein WC386_00955 [Candidatus Paceibacterota bacterium]|jgi:hypothetical protein